MNTKMLVICTLIAVVLLTGCNTTNFEPIYEDTPGIWNHYFVYPLSWLLIVSAELLSGSFGLSIIIVTLIIRFILLPLTLKQTKSSIAIKKMQPALDQLKERKDLKNDQQKYQQELLNLYQEHGVNPVAGCLPMFIQLPILMAFYFAIMRTESLYDNTFLWVTLGQQDQLFLFPLLAAITTYYSTKISMTSLTDQTRILLYIMPVMIFAASVVMPSALSLYWVVGNIFVIVQSYFLLHRNPVMNTVT